MAGDFEFEQDILQFRAFTNIMNNQQPVTVIEVQCLTTRSAFELECS